MAWSVKFSKFGLLYELKEPIKSQCLDDFVSDLRKDFHVDEKWILYVDGSSSKKGSRAGILLEGGILEEKGSRI